jgi:hypothetical protein
MNYDNLTTRSVKESLAFRGRVNAQRKAVQDYPAVLDVLERIHRALLVDDQVCSAIPRTFAIQLPPSYDVDTNGQALAVFGWAVRSDGLVASIGTH